jgi:hypothetical protein
MSGAVTYTLLHPVELRKLDGEVTDTVREVQLNRLRGGQARRVLNAQPKGPGEFAFVLICESASLPPSTFDKLDAEDVMALMELAAPFLGKSQAS